MRKDRKTLKYGILGGILASMCCWGPILLISLGLISTSSALSIGYRSPWFLWVGIVFTIGIVIFHIRKQSCGTKKQNLWSTLGTSLAIILLMIATTYFLKDIVVPWLAPYAYQ